MLKEIYVQAALALLLASDAVPADFFFSTSVLLCFHRSLLEIFFTLFSSPILMRAAALSPQGE